MSLMYSAVVGSQAFIKRCRWYRKAFGGGIRQAGMIAAPADYALTHHFPRLARTHALARRLAEGLKEAGCEILAPVDTNMVSNALLSKLRVPCLADSLGFLLA